MLSFQTYLVFCATLLTVLLRNVSGATSNPTAEQLANRKRSFSIGYVSFKIQVCLLLYHAFKTNTHLKGRFSRMGATRCVRPFGDPFPGNCHFPPLRFPKFSKNWYWYAKWNHRRLFVITWLWVSSQRKLGPFRPFHHLIAWHRVSLQWT